MGWAARKENAVVADQPPDCSKLVAETRAWPSESKPGAMRAFVKRWEEANECRRLQEAGWSPIEAVATSGREVRRVTFNDGRFAFRIPAVALERTPDGKVTVSLGIGGGVREAEVPARLWDKLTATDDAARIRPPPSSTPPSTAILHCGGARLEGASGGRAWTRPLSECSEGDKPGVAYAHELARIAVDLIPRCQAAREKAAGEPTPDQPVWILIDCAGRFDPLTLPR
jgi:hypothetical protein